MIICGTGHRPDKLGGYDVRTDDRLMRTAADYLSGELDLMDGNPDATIEVISGMALGWDQALAVAAIAMGIPFVAAVPFAGQEEAWPSKAQARYRDILGEASEVAVISEGRYAAWKMQVRNQWMVDRADKVVALWNGTSGGTANCIKYAEKKGKDIINLWDIYNQ